MTDKQTPIYQFDAAQCREDNGDLVWLADAWGESDLDPVFKVEGVSLVEVLKKTLAKLEITDGE